MKCRNSENMKRKNHSRMATEAKLGIWEFRFSVLHVIDMVKLVSLEYPYLGFAINSGFHRHIMRSIRIRINFFALPV